MTNKKEPQSSPLPWRTHYEGDPVVICDGDGEFAAMTLPAESDGATQADYDRASLIVKRVNQGPAFDALETLAREIVQAVDDGMKVPEEIYNGARAALKLAQEVR